MKVEINLKGNKAVVKESNNIVDALEEFNLSWMKEKYGDRAI